MKRKYDIPKMEIMVFGAKDSVLADMPDNYDGVLSGSGKGGYNMAPSRMATGTKLYI